MLYFLVLTSGLGSSWAFAPSPGRLRPCGSRVGRRQLSCPGKERGSSTSALPTRSSPPHGLESPGKSRSRWCAGLCFSGSRNCSCCCKAEERQGRHKLYPACPRRALPCPGTRTTHRSQVHTHWDSGACRPWSASHTHAEPQPTVCAALHTPTNPRSTNVTHTARTTHSTHRAGHMNRM